MRVLVVNAGSSSLKYAIDDDGVLRVEGQVAGMGDGTPVEVEHVVDRRRHVHAGSPVDHAGAARLMLEQFREHGPAWAHVDAVAHRVVHGGDRVTQAVAIDASVEELIAEMAERAPLHHPACQQVMQVVRAALPRTPHFAVFDTAFHTTMPEAAATYAVPTAWKDDWGVRRYGAHGISHQSCARRAWHLLGQPHRWGVVVLHLGGGASACAVRDGRSVDVSMGLTPLEGLVGATRSGDVDPAVVAYVGRRTGEDAATVTAHLMRQSGLLGLSGSADFRRVEERARAGDARAQAAIDVVVHRLVRYIGGYAAVMGRLDAIVFTGGVGRHSADLRARVLNALAVFGARIDHDANVRGAPETPLTTTDSAVTAWAMDAQEEIEMARQVRELLHPGTRSPG